MSPELAKLALFFLGRVTLNGQEAGGFIAVVKELERICAPALTPEGLGDQPDVDHS